MHFDHKKSNLKPGLCRDESALAEFRAAAGEIKGNAHMVTNPFKEISVTDLAVYGAAQASIELIKLRKAQEQEEDEANPHSKIT